MREWKAIHIYYYDNQDFLIMNGICPVLKKYNISDFFFIRYWEHGPHIRLRLLNLDKNTFEAIKVKINTFIKSKPSDIRIIEDEYCKLSADYAKKENINKKSISYMLPNNTLHNAAYTPEIEKFHGEEGVTIAEDEFIYSSALAVNILNVANAKKQKLYFGAAFVLSLLNTVMKNKNELKSFMILYREYWERYATLNPDIKIRMMVNIKDHTINIEAINKIKNFYTTNNFEKIHKSIFNKIADLSDNNRRTTYDFLMNFIHLFNNRIGIIPLEEIELMMICEKIMEDNDE